MPAASASNSNDRTAPLQQIINATQRVQELMAIHMQQKITNALPDQLEDTEDGQALINTIDDVFDIHTIAFQTVHDSKQETAEAKAAMDEKHVGLQNVMYEKRHLIEEILKCKSFRSVYQDVDLVPLEEFQSNAPTEYLQDQENPHQLMINRLKYEHQARISLKEQEEKLQAERLALIRENRKAQEKLDRFDKLLDDFVQASVPVENALLEEEKKALAIQED
ncbi:Fms-interacting protein-domain-containing protein [Phascolomyces articulosus]|uniref:Fms-interacting protein-domain-containing protein n=1 Tax=Phascolomyces articulosus TaxID=60185 RepID=A0AAD5K7D9_9FUNG|nr:Fms-interacting protein-domain-containing protein [Phascolomyces articulosus]